MVVMTRLQHDNTQLKVKSADLVGAGDLAEALTLDLDHLVVRALVGGDGVDGGGGAGGEAEGKLI